MPLCLQRSLSLLAEKNILSLHDSSDPRKLTLSTCSALSIKHSLLKSLAVIRDDLVTNFYLSRQTVISRLNSDNCLLKKIINDIFLFPHMSSNFIMTVSTHHCKHHIVFRFCYNLLQGIAFCLFVLASE